MKKHLFTFVLLMATTVLFAQSPLGKGGKQLNAGFGFSSWGLPIYVGLDFGVHKDITLGLEGSFRSYNDNYIGYKYSHTILGFSGNGNYHFNSLLKIPSAWDLYAGLNVGFYVWMSDDNYHGSHSSGLGLGGQCGIRYFFNDKWAVNLEGGSGNAFSGGKIGITYKL